MADYRYKYVLFDLDGTLTDSCEGITNCVWHALKKMGITVGGREELLPFIGPPLRHSFKHFYSMSDEEAERAVSIYRERYSTVGLYELKVYDGIPEALQKLRDRGQILAVATSKPEVFTKRILQKFGLSVYFSVVVGCELDGTREKKSEVIAEALRQLGNPEKSDVVMVGDRHFDVNGAKANGIDCVGVNYGFAEDGELTAAGAIDCVDSASELTNVL